MEILQETKTWIAVHKPAGLAVQTRRIGEADLESELMKQILTRDPKAGRTRLQVIHRLDQPVEGIVLCAKTPQAAAALSAQLREGSMEKEYLACVQTKDSRKPEETWHHLTDCLVRDGRTNHSAVVPPETPGAKKAELAWKTLAAAEDTAILAIRLYTGRHHQIRVQLSHAGMPILGDRKYGNTPQEKTGTVPDPYPALCAYRLSFTDPDTNKRVQLQIQPKNKRLSGIQQ